MLDRTVFLDASVLYPAPLRDLLMYVALAGLFQPRWSDEIHVEWINAVLRQRPDIQRAQLERTRDLMNRAVPYASVNEYAGEWTTVESLPDPGDRHVVAAAIKGEADTILTFNLKHFPENALTPHGLRAIHPDPFFCELLDLDPAGLTRAMRENRLSLKKPPRTAQEYLETLKAQRLPGLVGAVMYLQLDV